MIDLHCHILPGIDDGPINFMESTEMIELAYESGTRTIVATPHIHHPKDFPKLVSARHLVERLNAFASSRYLDFRICLGAEYFIKENFEDYIDDINHFTINDSNYVLVEFEPHVRLSFMLEVVSAIQSKGLVPILAHVERYSALKLNTHGLTSLKSAGMLLQVSAKALVDKSELAVSRWLMTCIGRTDIDFVASDGHATAERSPLLHIAYRQVLEQLGPEAALRVMTYNPDLVLKNAPVSAILQAPIGESVGFQERFNRWFERAAFKWELIIAILAFVIGAVGLILGLGNV